MDEPADEKRQAANHILGEAGRKIGVVKFRIKLEQALRIVVGALGQRKTADLTLLHQRHVVGGYSRHYAHGEQGIAVVGARLQHRFGALLRVVHGLQELLTDSGVGLGTGFFHQAVVVGEKLAFQGAQAVEFIEKVRRAPERVGQRLLRMRRDIPIQRGMSGREIEIVETAQGIVDGGFGGQRGNRADCSHQER